MSRTRTHLLLLALTLAALALRLWRLGDMPLFADEAYYLLWAGRPAPGYFDHPSGVAVLLWLSTALGGRGEFGVRWLNALLSTAAVPLAYAVGRRYVSARGGWIAAAAAALAPVYVLTGRVVYGDALQNGLLLVCLTALPRRGQGALLRWAAFGLALAALLNVKLTSGFAALGFALCLLLWRRADLRGPGPWLAALIAAAGLAPFVMWSAQHDWPTLRLAVSQGSGFGLEGAGLLASLAHAGRYHTLPAALLAGLATLAAVRWAVRAAGRASGQAHADGPRLLALLSACLLLPVLLSAADSPRNLGLGLLTLWPLAGLGWGGAGRGRLWLKPQADMGENLLKQVLGSGAEWASAHFSCIKHRFQSVAGLTLCILLATGIYAVGTAAALLSPTPLPHSPAADTIRADAAPWPAVAPALAAHDDRLIFAVDYSIAGQLAYYSGRPVYSAAGQFRIWGVPDAENWLVLAQDYLPPERVSARLRAGFAKVSGPQIWPLAGGARKVYVWDANARQQPTLSVLASLDYLDLARK